MNTNNLENNLRNPVCQGIAEIDGCAAVSDVLTGMTGNGPSSATNTSQAADSETSANTVPAGCSGIYEHPQHPPPAPEADQATIEHIKARRAAIEQGKLCELMLLIRSDPRGLLAERDFGDLAACILEASAKDAAQLTDEVYGLILAIGSTLLARSILALEFQLKSADGLSGSEPIAIPEDLLGNGLLEYLMRFAELVADISSRQARVKHLEKLAKPPRKAAGGGEQHGGENERGEDGQVN